MEITACDNNPIWCDGLLGRLVCRLPCWSNPQLFSDNSNIGPKCYSLEWYGLGLLGAAISSTSFLSMWNYIVLCWLWA